MKTIVVFRAERSGLYKGGVTAVFPYEPWAADGSDMTCYEHVGQHGACSLSWYRTTRPAKPEEYADLTRELQTWGPPDAHYDLDVRQRIPHDAHAKRRAAARRPLPD